MPIDNKKLKNLYDAMRQEGYDQSYDEFRGAFLGNNNYANRKDIYDTMSSGGYNLGKTYAEFMTSMQVAPKQANNRAAAQAAAAKSAPTKKRPWQPGQGAANDTEGYQPTAWNSLVARQQQQYQSGRAPRMEEVVGQNFARTKKVRGQRVDRKNESYVYETPVHEVGWDEGEPRVNKPHELSDRYENAFENPILRRTDEIENGGRQYERERNLATRERLATDAYESMLEGWDNAPSLEDWKRIMVDDSDEAKNMRKEIADAADKAGRTDAANLIRYIEDVNIPEALPQHGYSAEDIQGQMRYLDQERAIRSGFYRSQFDDIDDRIAHIDEMQDKLSKDASRHYNGGVAGAFAAPGVPNMGEVYGHYYGDPYLNAAKRSLEDAKSILDESDRHGNTSFVGGAFRGFGNKLFDVRTWDMGITEIGNGLHLKDVLEKADRGERLTPSEDELLKAKVTEMAVNAYFGSYLGRGYKAGQVTAQSLPFMLEMMINPLSATGKSAQAMLTRYAIKKFGLKLTKEAGEGAAKKILQGGISETAKAVINKSLSGEARRIAAKALASRAGARIGGDVIGAASMTATTGQGHVVADLLNRTTGKVNFKTNDEGKVVYAGHDAPEESNILKAYAKSFGSQFIENHSEFMGDYFPYIGAIFSRGLDKIGGKYMVKGFSAFKNRSASAVMRLPFAPMAADFIRNASKSKWAKIIKGIQKRVHWNGPLNEYLEEVAGNIENAILVGDNDFSTEEGRGVFNLSDNIDTFLGVSLMSGAMLVSSAAGYRTPAYRARKMVENADARGEKLLGGSLWGKFKSSFDAAQSEQDKQVILTALLQNSSLTNEGRMAALQYARGKQFQQAVADGTFREMEEDAEKGNEVERACRAEYTEGQNIDSVEEMRDAKTRYNVLLREALAVEPNAEIYSDPQFYEQSNPNATPEQKAAMRAYAEAKAQYEGVADRMKTDMADQQQKANEQVERFKNQTDGLITRVRLRGSDAEFYVTSGHISLNNDGTINDAATSSNLTIVDGEGNQRFISRGDVVDVLAQNTPEETLEQLNDIIMNEAKAKADLIDGKLSFHAGDTFTILNNEGQEQKVTIAQDPSTMAMSAVIEGEQAAVPLTEDSMAKLQQMSDAYQESRFGKYRQEQQDAVANAENEATQEEATPTSPTASQEETSSPTEGRSYGYGESVSYVDGEGHTQEGVVHGKTPDGTYEVEFDNPPSGKNVVDEYTQEELDALVQPSSAEQTEEVVPEQVPEEEPVEPQGNDAANSVPPTTEELVEMARGGNELAQYQLDQQGIQWEEPAEQTKDNAAAQSPKKDVPRDKDGNIIYDQVPVATTIEDLYDGALDDEEIGNFVQSQIDAAKKAVDKITKKKPQISTNKSAYLEAKKKWEGELREAERKALYWNDVKAEVEKITTPADERTDDNSGSEGGKDSEGEVRTRDEGSDEQESSSEESAVEGQREQETDIEHGEEANEEIKPIGKSRFGNIYDQFKGKIKEAFNFLMKHKSGDLLGVFHREGFGDVDLVWGSNERSEGLDHIIEKHIKAHNDFDSVEDAMTTIDDVIRNGSLNEAKSKWDKVIFEKDGYTVVVSLNVRDNQGNITDNNKKWIVTAFDGSHRQSNKKRESSSDATLVTPSTNEGGRAVAPDDDSSDGKGKEKVSSKQGSVGRKNVYGKNKVADWRTSVSSAMRQYETSPHDAHVAMCDIIDGMDSNALYGLMRMVLRTITSLDNENIRDGWKVDATHDLFDILKDRGFVVTKGSKGVAIGDVVIDKHGIIYVVEGVGKSRLDCGLYDVNDKTIIDHMTISRASVKYYYRDVNGKKDSERSQKADVVDAELMAEEKPFNAIIEMLRKKFPDASMEALTAADRLLREQALPGERQKAIEAVAKALGLKVEWRDTMEKENGTFNPKTRIITIARDSEHALANTFGHEVTHAVRNLSEADYKNLKDAVRRLYSSEKEYNEAVQAYGDMYTGLDFDALEEELIADNIGFMIGGRNDMTQELASRMNHRVLWAIHDAMNKVRNALAKVLHIDSKKNGLLEAIDSARATIRETMANAQRIAKEKGQGHSNESGSARQSLRTQDTPLLDVDGKPIVVKADDGKVELNLRTWQDEKQQVRDALLDGGLEPEAVDAMMAQAETIASGMSGLLGKYPLFGAWQKVAATNRPILRNNNGGYLSFDYSFNCVKKDALNAVMEALVADGKGSHLGVTQVEALKKVLQKHGFLTPCVMCYVEAKRKVYKQSKEMAAKWNAVAETVGLNGEEMGAERELGAEQRHALEQLANGENLGSVKGFAAQGGDGIKKDTIVKIAKLMLNSAKLRGRMNYEWLMSPNSYTEMYNKFGDTGLMEFISQGQSRGKALLEASPFSFKSIPSDLMTGMYNPVALANLGGVRQFSYEDARAVMFFDYYTQFLVMQGARAPEHLYTKRPFMPEMFGRTGAMMNQSLIVDIWRGEEWHKKALGLSDKDYDEWLTAHAGFVPRGALPKGHTLYEEGSTELVPNWGVESFPVDIAMKNVHNKDYKGTVGNVVVAPNREFILWALDNPDIHMVLAYHAKGANPLMKSLTGYDRAEAMDDGYHTHDKDGRVVSELSVPETGLEIHGGALQWNLLLRRNGYDARKAAQVYLDYCKEHGLTPMFCYDGVVDMSGERATSHPEYYKLLTDFRVYDEDGNSIRQRAVKAVLPENWQVILDKYLQQESSLSGKVGNIRLDEGLMNEINAVTRFASIESGERDTLTKLLTSIYGKGNVQVLATREFDAALDEVTDRGHAQMLRDNGGTVYGFAVGDRIVLNEDLFNANTPMHEHTHVYMKVLKATNPRLYNRGMELWRDTPLWNQAKRGLEALGEEPTDEQIFSECMSQFTGAENEKIISEVTGITDKNWLQKAMSWLSEMWKGVKSAFARWTQKDLDGLTAEQFGRMPLRAVYDAKERKAYTERVEQVFGDGGARAHDVVAKHEALTKPTAGPREAERMEIKQSLRMQDTASEFAEKYGVSADDVRQYVEGMKSGNLQKADWALSEIRRTMRVANRGMKLSEFGKLFRPIQKELAERYGDIERLRQEHIDAEMRERNLMEAARKKAEEEERNRQARLEELSLLGDAEVDKRYMDALKRGDEATAREMLDEAARRKGYGDAESDYQGEGAWAAPSNPGYKSADERRADLENNTIFNVEDMALGYSSQPSDYFEHPKRYLQDTPHGLESTQSIQKAIEAVKRGDKDVKVKVYRAVPTSVKEGKLRNGDWVTPSKKYAEMHGNSRLEGKYRIIEDEVPVDDLWWDGNDANEWGYDNGKGYKYKNVKNNRKSDDLVTRDDKGNVIPPSKRFNQRKADERYQKRTDGVKPSKAEVALRDALVEHMRLSGMDVISDEAGQRVLDMANGDDAKEQRIYHGSGADFDHFDHIRFFRTANGEAYGFTVGGKIYIDPRIATSETPVHEYAHLWATALKSANAKEWQNVVGLMKGTKVWDEVKALYPELKSDDEIADEVLATYSGRRGAERLREEQRRIAKGNGSVFEKAEAISALESVKQALKRFWKGVADFLHIHYTSAEEVADRVMKDLLDGVDPRTFGDVEKGIRFQTSEELNNRFGSRWLDEQTNDDGRHTTQVKSTINSYKKFGDWVKRDSNGRDVDVLDASSGLGLGTAWMRDNGFKVDDVEPFPSDSREAPTFSSYDEIDKKYDYIISNAVLNVIPDDWRANVLHQMADKLKDGGKLVINVRGAEGIRKQGIEGKTRTTLDDASEILVHRPDGSIKSYQKGFTKSELKDWCEKELGEGYSVEIANNKNAGGSYDTAVVVTKNNESDIETINTKFNEELQQQIDGTLPEGHIYKMGKPGRILLSTGVPNLPIQMNAKRLQVKATLFDHDFDLSEVKDLVRVLQHPLAVFAYGDKSKAQNIIVPLQKDGKNFIVGLSLNPTVGGRKLEINSIRNVFPKDNSEWLNWINQDKALYIDKEKIQTLIDQQRTNLADVAYLDLDSVANVMENFENPKVSDENVADGGIMFRNGGAADAEKQSRRGTPNLYPDHIAQAIYEQSVNGFKFDLDEAWHDSLLSVKRLQEAISETRGVPIRDFENVYWHAVALSSVNAAEMEQLMNLRIQPFIEAVQDICKKHDLTQEDIEVYLNCKHGLERNEAMARKFAKTKAEEEFKAELKKAQKTATANPNDQDAADALDDVKQRMNDREEELYLENRKKDYSGLTDIFDPKDKVTGDRLDLTVSELEDKAKKCVDDFENKVGVVDVTKLWDNIHELNNYSLRKSYLSGLISKSQYDSVKQMYQWYVPLRGFNEEVAGDVYTYVTRGETRTQQLLKEAKGRTSRAGDILATMMNMANSAVNQGNRNLMKQKILNLALNAKSPLLSVSSTWYQTDANGFDVPIEPPINDQMTPSEQKDAIEQWEDTMEIQAKQGKVHRMSDNLRLNLRTQKWQADEHCIRVQRGGKEYCVWVNGNPRAAQALNDRLGNQVTKPYKATETILDKAEDLFTDGFIKIFRYMAQSVTSLNPEFVISNFQRDLASASLISTGKYGVGYTKDFLVNVKRLGVLTGTTSHKKEYRNAAGIYTLYNKYKSRTLDNNNEMERYFAEFMANGGETGYTQSLSIKDYQSRIQSALGDKGFVKWSKNAGHAVADFVEMANRGVENTCRFAAYMTSRQHGKSVLQAIVDAKEASTNFNLHGAGGLGNAWLRKSIIFINPAVQSIVQYCQLTAKHPKAMLSMLGGTILLGAAMAFACARMVAPGGGDPDSNYWDLSDYVRHNYIVIPSGNGNWTRIALPPEIRAVYGLGVIAMEAAMGRMNHSSIPAAIGDQLMQLSPVAFLDPRNFFNRSDSDHSVGKTLIKAFTPTLASPIADAYIWDEDFMGRQITGKNDFNDDKPEFQRVSYDTLPQLVSFSRWLNNISGGNDYKKGWININPSAAGYVASQYFGGPLQFFTKIGKTVAMITYEDLRDMRNVPFLSRFMTSTDNDYGRNQVSNAEFKYWSAIADDVRTQIRGFEKEIESGDTKNLDDYKKLVSSKEYEMYQMIDYMDWLKDIRELNQKRKEETTQDAQKQVTLEIYEVRRKMAECLNKAEEMGVYLDMSQLNLELANAKTTEERAAIQAKINEKRKENLRKIGAIE